MLLNDLLKSLLTLLMLTPLLILVTLLVSLKDEFKLFFYLPTELDLIIISLILLPIL